MKSPDETPDPLFPGMPHDVHRAIWTLLDYANSWDAARDLLAEYALKMRPLKTRRIIHVELR